MSGPLSHIRLLDLSRVLAGPWAAQTLADLGATVIKVEKPDGGDDTRSWGPPYVMMPDGRQTGETAYFLSANRGKRSITIDMSRSDGQKIVRALAARSDVMLETSRSGRWQSTASTFLRFEQSTLSLIYCSITGFGQTGPYRDKPGYDFMI
jgi:crotonobetainyl-CoA:carnitine CoA-transferase CaiB-like acyl-CoA transferase